MLSRAARFSFNFLDNLLIFASCCATSSMEMPSTAMVCNFSILEKPSTNQETLNPWSTHTSRWNFQLEATSSETVWPVTLHMSSIEDKASSTRLTSANLLVTFLVAAMCPYLSDILIYSVSYLAHAEATDQHMIWIGNQVWRNKGGTRN